MIQSRIVHNNTKSTTQGLFVVWFREECPYTATPWLLHLGISSAQPYKSWISTVNYKCFYST
jgi:hypothetical protein